MKTYFSITSKDGKKEPIYIKVDAHTNYSHLQYVKDFCENRNILLDEVEIKQISFIKIP